MDDSRIDPPEGYVVDECNVSKTGHCALHGIEIERRKSTQKDLTSLKDRVNRLDNVIDVRLTKIEDRQRVHADFRNNLLGGMKWGGTLLLLVVLGSYSYIYNHIQEANRKETLVQAEIKYTESERKQLAARLKAIEIESGRGDERANATNARLSSIDGRLAQIFGLLMKGGKISSDDVLEMYKQEGKK